MLASKNWPNVNVTKEECKCFFGIFRVTDTME